MQIIWNNFMSIYELFDEYNLVQSHSLYNFAK